MKNFKINLADGLAVFLLILKIFTPYFASSININTSVLIMLINCYIIAYLSYLISFMESKKVVIMALPLLIYTGFLFFYKNGFVISKPNKIADDLLYLITNVFDVVFVSFVFFLVELILNRIFGSKITTGFAVLGLILYFVMHNTDIIPFDILYKDVLVYFSFYVIATRLSPAQKINKALYPIALILFVGEIIAYAYYQIYPGFYLSLYLLTYIILKGMENVELVNFKRYLSLAYLYPYHVINIILTDFIKASPLVISIMAVLITYVISQLIYKLRIKYINYLLVGIN